LLNYYSAVCFNAVSFLSYDVAAAMDSSHASEKCFDLLGNMWFLGLVPVPFTVAEEAS
jgi:hypothetical protein